MSNDNRREQHKVILHNDNHNQRGKIISTSDIPVRIKPQHLITTNRNHYTSHSGNTTHIPDLQNKFDGRESFQVHSHDGRNWHQIPKGNTRQRGDQVPLSPRSNQSLTDRYW